MNKELEKIERKLNKALDKEKNKSRYRKSNVGTRTNSRRNLETS